MAPQRWHGRAIGAVLIAQLLTALADNALLIVAIALLEARHAPGWITPALRVGFYASYVLLAPVAGRWADVWPKGPLMAAVNILKFAGVLALACGADPLLVFAAIGCGAAAAAPARYGILPELTAGRDLVQANAAMEIVTIIAIIGGYALGSALVAGPSAVVACLCLAVLYAAGAACTARRIGGGNRIEHTAGLRFGSGARILLGDPAARQALALTSVFWAAAAVLQFAVIDWARRTLGLSLAYAAFLPALFAIGMVGGALIAGARSARRHPWGPALSGVALGGAIMLMPLADSVAVAGVLLASAGVLAGALLVPMNATLQERGSRLMAPGLSVAVQNALENGLSIVFLATYGLALACAAPVTAILIGLGLLVICLVLLSAARGVSTLQDHPC